MDSSVISSYENAIALENDMRKNMYVTKDPRYYQPLYGLVKLTHELWSSLASKQSSNRNLLFNTLKLTKNPLGEAKGILKSVSQKIPNTLVAGGAVFSSLFGLKIS